MQEKNHKFPEKSHKKFTPFVFLEWNHKALKSIYIDVLCYPEMRVKEHLQLIIKSITIYILFCVMCLRWKKYEQQFLANFTNGVCIKILQNDKQLKKYNLNYLSNIYSTTKKKHIQRNTNSNKTFHFFTSQSQLTLALSYWQSSRSTRKPGNEIKCGKTLYFVRNKKKQ